MKKIAVYVTICVVNSIPIPYIRKLNKNNIAMCISPERYMQRYILRRKYAK